MARGETLGRLRRLRARHDLDVVLRQDLPIAPAAEAGADGGARRAAA